MVDVHVIAAALKDLNNRLSAVEHTVNDVLIKSLLEANDEYCYEDGLDKFKATYGAKLDPLLTRMKALYGDDYDGYKDLYDTMQGHLKDDGFDEDAYVADQIAQVNAKLDALVATSAPKAPDAIVVEEEAALPDDAELAKELKAAQ